VNALLVGLENGLVVIAVVIAILSASPQLLAHSRDLLVNPLFFCEQTLVVLVVQLPDLVVELPILRPEGDQLLSQRRLFGTRATLLLAVAAPGLRVFRARAQRAFDTRQNEAHQENDEHPDAHATSHKPRSLCSLLATIREPFGESEGGTAAGRVVRFVRRPS
jgi:hypothetical protein